MSKLIATFPNDPNNSARSKFKIYISTAGVEVVSDPSGVTTLDPIEARTFGMLLSHASHEADMMRMRQIMEDEHHSTEKEIAEVAAIVQGVRKPGP